MVLVLGVKIHPGQQASTWQSRDLMSKQNPTLQCMSGIGLSRQGEYIRCVLRPYKNGPQSPTDNISEQG